MKKTITINLNNITFTIDDDAYDLLQAYLSDIATHFASDPEQEEIMNDIEARIAELFGESLSKNKHVINLSDVRTVMEVMGNPSQFVDDDGSSEDSDKHTSPEEEVGRKKDRSSRRFYRDPENAILGGVGGGLAAYFGMDATIVRILIVLLFSFFTIFSGGWFILCTYILLWIIAPKAVTTSQRLEMQGEAVTIENIKAEFQNLKSYVESEGFNQNIESIGKRFVNIFGVVFKIIGSFVAVALSLLGFVLLLCFFTLLAFLIFEPDFIQAFLPFISSSGLEASNGQLLLLLLGTFLIVACPMCLIGYGIVRLLRRKQTDTPVLKSFWAILILWFAGLISVAIVGSRLLPGLKYGMDGNTSRVEENLIMTDEIRELPPFHAIDVSGNIELELRQDTAPRVMLSTYESYSPKLQTEVRNGVLHIYSTSVFHTSFRVRLQISMDSISSISVRGACDIKSRSPLHTSSSLVLALYGASQANLEAVVDRSIDIDIHGASKLTLSGRSDSLKIRSSGASKIQAGDLRATHVYINLKGAGEADVHALHSIEADAKGVSKITCYGHPAHVKQDTGPVSSFRLN